MRQCTQNLCSQCTLCSLRHEYTAVYSEVKTSCARDVFTLSTVHVHCIPYPKLTYMYSLQWMCTAVRPSIRMLCTGCWLDRKKSLRHPRPGSCVGTKRWSIWRRKVLPGFYIHKSKEMKNRSGIYDCVQIRHGLYIQCMYLFSAGRPVLRYFCLSQRGVNMLFIRPSDVTNSEHKLRQFSNSLTFYFRILA